MQIRFTDTCNVYHVIKKDNGRELLEYVKPESATLPYLMMYASRHRILEPYSE